MPAGDWRVWEKDRKRVAQEIVEGRPFQVWDTERGRFDAMFDFPLRSGLWDAAVGMRPSQLKKEVIEQLEYIKHPMAEPETAWRDLLSICLHGKG